ncbi:MAG: peptidylprolyl isomerase, partial [Methylobacterium sp.]|nr:peptidylprolyl isomerase [Methylobacterium sp.]
MFAEAPGLNGQYTIWGRVVEGMEHVDRIRRVDPQRERVPKEQLDKMIRVRVAADIR